MIGTVVMLDRHVQFEDQDHQLLVQEDLGVAVLGVPTVETTVPRLAQALQAGDADRPPQRLVNQSDHLVEPPQIPLAAPHLMSIPVE